MIRLNSLAVPLGEEVESRGGIVQTSGALVRRVARALDIPARQVRTIEVLKRNIDARRKSNVHFTVNVAVQLADEELEVISITRGAAQPFTPYQPLQVPRAAPGQLSGDFVPPVVVGTGPAGMFAALYLARAGLRPLVLERGLDVDGRAKAVAAFDAGGPLDPECNIQFGEGGAGTFSDGKLTTGIKHEMAPHVLHLFAEAGAPENILWDARPHIGSDKLPAVVANLREQIIEAGGQVLFATRLTDVFLEDGVLRGIQVQDASGARRIDAHKLVLACGHSARDTFAMLHARGVAMGPKPFSVGVRIEHPQQMVNQAQWGAAADNPALGAAEYKLSWQEGQGRKGAEAATAHGGEEPARAYTFCMCPGGQVTCAASEPKGVVTNGMSLYARDGKNANAGLLVNVGPADFEADGFASATSVESTLASASLAGGSATGTAPAGGASRDGVLAGVKYQRRIERAAYKAALAAGGSPYQAPAQTVGDFLSGRSGTPSTLVQPTYARGVAWCDLHDVLPARVCAVLEQALPALDAKMHGFAHPQAVLTAPETRSSSPVHIATNAGKQAVLAQTLTLGSDGETTHTQAANAESSDARQAPGCGIYPCGEGAGLAGGIMSAACNGLAVARELVGCVLSQASD